MKTKIIPFDLETAKKIQAGEIEGRIVTANDIAVSIRIENNKVLLEDLWFDCSADGVLNGMIRLFIELPEEAPKQLTLDDCYVEDKVWVKYKDNYILVKIKDKNPNGLIYVSNLMSSNYEELYFSKYTKVYRQKPQFKPFDKVLVRDDSTQRWQPRLYGYISPEGTTHFTQDGHEWFRCIPYAGNEHLVGTTDKPKED